MPLDVEQVCTDEDLEDYTLGALGLQALLPDEWMDGETKTARRARQRVLDVVLQSLARRRPPIRPEELLDPSELKTVVCYGTLEILHNGAIDHAESPHIAKTKRFGQLFRDELGSLQPSIHAGATAASLSIRVSRG